MVIMASSIARGRYCSWAHTHDGDDDDDDNDRVVQKDGHTPNNGLTETCGLLCTYLILDIHVMIN